MKPYVMLYETETSYCSEINGKTITISKNDTIIRNGVMQHPRLEAIEQAAKAANVSDYIVVNIS